VGRIGQDDLMDQAIQGTAELHGFLGGQIDRHHVDHPEGEISNESGTALPLRDNTGGANA
jgi:hypothetical protein